MKKNIIGSLIGIAVVIASDIIIRLLFSIILNMEIFLFRYSAYPQMYWGVLICLLTFATSFMGAAVSVRYPDSKKNRALVLFGFILMGVRYGQIHYVMEVELLLPIVALVLSLGATILAWKVFLKKRKEAIPGSPPSKKHHQPNTTGG